MSAPFIVQSITPENGMRKVLLALIRPGKTNYIHADVEPEVLAMIFGEEVCEGDTRAISAPLIRAGTNGTNRG